MSPRQGTNLDWEASVVIAGAAGSALYIWLLTQRPSADRDLLTLVSWRTPFLPPHRYPFRFWLLAGESMAAGGLVAIARDTMNGSAYSASFSGTFVFLGAAVIIVSLLAFLRASKRA